MFAAKFIYSGLETIDWFSPIRLIAQGSQFEVWKKGKRRSFLHSGLALRSCFIARFHGLISCRAEYGNSTVSRQFSIEAPPAVLAFEEDVGYGIFILVSINTLQILFYLIFSTILLLLLIPSILIINRYCSIPSSSLTTTISSTPSSPEVSEWESVTPRALLNQPPIARSESVISIVHSLPWKIKDHVYPKYECNSKR